MKNSDPNSQSTPCTTPWDTPWPGNELESVPSCPVCGSHDREVLHKDLIDNVFYVAQGKWILQSCLKCNSAYLDPRPNADSIDKAYESYYTHETSADKDNFFSKGLIRRIPRMIANDYLNYHYGTHYSPAIFAGRFIARLVPKKRQSLDVRFRYLPRPGPDAAVLDIGCGNGWFLRIAKDAGWQVTGMDIDPKAVNMARKHGLDIMTGTIDLLEGESEKFDAITFNHVLEHVHDPRLFLTSVRRLLKPGGTVYIETPNIGSNGAEMYKNSWRGIEAPRHLVLFNLESLKYLLSEIGFNSFEVKRHVSVRKWMNRTSAEIADRTPAGQFEVTKPGWLQKLKKRVFAVPNERLEFISLTARKCEK